MAKRDPGRVNLEQAIREIVGKAIDELAPRSERFKTLIEEVRELRAALAALDKRLDRGATSAPRRAKAGARGGKGRPGRPPIFTACTVPGCPREHYAKGLCSMHYQQWRRTNEWPGAPELDPAKKTRAVKATRGRKPAKKATRGPGRPAKKTTRRKVSRRA